MRVKSFLPGQLRLILGVTLVHVVAWFTYYSQIPAGQSPNQEALATLDAALSLAQGTASSPQHSLYTYTLSIFARNFGDIDSLTAVARTLNALALLITTGFCASAAGHYWHRNRTIWAAGLLVGLNPVLVFWAGIVNPSLWAAACISIAIWRIQRWLLRPKRRDTLWIGASLALAAAFETTLIPIALLWPVCAAIYAQRKHLLQLILALVAPLTLGSIFLVSSLQLQEPLQFNLQHIGTGLYQALGNREIHEGQSFGLYRQLHFLLLLNPIHWGALFILACGGVYAHIKDGNKGHSVLLACLVLALFAISSAILAGGSQARASMIPLLAIFAAGSLSLLPKIWKRASRLTRGKIITGGLLVSFFVYAGSWGTPQSQSWEPDYAYLAQANIVAGNNERASTWAQKALDLNSERSDMREILVVAQFNAWALGSLSRSLPVEETREYLRASQLEPGSATTQAIQGIYQYKLRETQKANELWQAQSQDSALALLCLYWTQSIEELPQEAVEAHEGRPYFELLEAAQQIDRNALEYGNLEKQVDNMLGFAY